VLQRYYIWKANQEVAQRELWTDARGYYFLNIIAVLPSEQRKGIGRALVEEVTYKADAEGMRCYLESSRDQPNTEFYESLGFKVVRNIDCNDDGVVCKLYCMIREPKLGV
jgi:GNAT superfamily N-acetyltransferase